MHPSPIVAFDQLLSESERRLISQLDSPYNIQIFLDELPYSTDHFYRCPIRVLRERTGHCFDGALFAAAMLRRIGYPPLILDLVPDNRDDDHLVALYPCDGHWGAVAKSNFVGLRFREPIYRSLRELVMSYFEHYYNIEREKTLRGYTLPLNLKTCDKFTWMTSDEQLDQIAQHLDKLRKIYIINDAMIINLSPVDQRCYEAGLWGSNEAGLFKPGCN